MNMKSIWAVLGVTAALCLGGFSPTQAAEIKIVINQSPWFDGFKKTVEKFDAVPHAAILEKVRNSLRAPRGIYDIPMIGVGWAAEIYSGGFLTPLEEISPSYSLPENVLDFDGALYWDKERKVMNARSGKLMTLPITGNPELFYYRKDIFDKNNIKVPENWDELTKAIEALNASGDVQYSYIMGGGVDDVLVRFTAYLLSAGGGIFRQPEEGDYTVIFNSPQSLQALEYYLSIVKAGGYPTPASLEQGEVIQLFSTGKSGIANIVAAARGPLTNPESSVIGDKLGVTTIPAPAGKTGYFVAGHWVAGIAANIPEAQKQASLAFLDWLIKRDNQIFLFEAGGVPVRSDLAGSSDDPLRFLPVLATSVANARITLPIKEAAQINPIVGRYLNEALLGKLEPKDALNKAAAEIVLLMRQAGYTSEALPDL